MNCEHGREMPKCYECYRELYEFRGRQILLLAQRLARLSQLPPGSFFFVDPGRPAAEREPTLRVVRP